MTPATFDPERPAPVWTAPLGTIEGASDVGVLVFTGYGLNCEDETSAGFEMLGARTSVRHFSDVIDDPAAFERVRIVVFGGGFSFGDHIASGRVFANRVKARLGDRLARFVDDGGLVLGICNGFQTIVKLGLVPGLERRVGDPLAAQQATVVHNDRLGYRNAWVRLAVDPDSPCVFTRGATKALLEVPSRHGEGKVLLDPEFEAEVLAKGLVPVRYADASGAPTQRWPDNPNGSPGAVAGLCDPTGRIFGLMPHPEAYLYPENHPNWIAQRDQGCLPTHGAGLGILAGGVRAALAPTTS
ncbi:MAG: phosphoribosylformylglycinamidine synthase subunit PurQ [Nannocystales bacterium]